MIPVDSTASIGGGHVFIVAENHDAAKKAYIMHSSVKGGVFCPVWNEEYIEKAIPFIRQAYEKASG